MAFEKVDPVFRPELVLVRLGVLEGHVAHVDVHERGARKEVLGLTGDHGDGML